jgi:MarR family transcriptional regulator for hemolysin
MSRNELPINILLYDTARLGRRCFDRRARPLGLTQPQWRMLAVLSRNEGVNQVSLAEYLDIQPITLTRQVDRLEANGWVRREPDPNDRRATLLFVTPKAQPLIDQIWGLADELAADMLDGVSTEDRKRTHEVLGKVRENFLRIEAAETDDCRSTSVEWSLVHTTKG